MIEVVTWTTNNEIAITRDSSGLLTTWGNYYRANIYRQTPADAAMLFKWVSLRFRIIMNLSSYSSSSYSVVTDTITELLVLLTWMQCALDLLHFWWISEAIPSL